MSSVQQRPLRPPAIILGGAGNALSVARSLSSAGIEVYAINHPQAVVRHSRLCKWIDLPKTAGDDVEAWTAYLVGRESDHLRGAVLLTASDEGIELIAKHRRQLTEKFTLDVSDPEAQLCMLNKLSTYRAAQAAGVPTPKFWVADSRAQIEQLRGDLTFPLIVKPLFSHKAQKVGDKLVRVEEFDELIHAFESMQQAGIRTFLVEVIPGLDDKLCSYYTYLDENGESVFDFTKRIIRRYPLNVGLGCYHVTDRVPQVKELSLRLLRQVGLRGIANVEFKLDERDGQLKLIECNARFTAADCLVAAAGVNISLYVYNRLTGQAQPPPQDYRVGLRLWYPIDDFRAYRQLHGMGLLSFRSWIGSILHPQTFPFFRWYDPLPAIVKGGRFVGDYLYRHLGLAKLTAQRDPGSVRCEAPCEAAEIRRHAKR
ncbi:MAG: ATP-grasp domain-containing protein [Acidobacteriia bacterium]|nr:ATP-grasp domain-containing protein [Terriglobia bacterium]